MGWEKRMFFLKVGWTRRVERILGWIRTGPRSMTGRKTMLGLGRTMPALHASSITRTLPCMGRRWSIMIVACPSFRIGFEGANRGTESWSSTLLVRSENYYCEATRLSRPEHRPTRTIQLRPDRIRSSTGERNSCFPSRYRRLGYDNYGSGP